MNTVQQRSQQRLSDPRAGWASWLDRFVEPEATS